ncbi:hypothetical protein K4K52_001279 [Colletotrichum sp. SAR 10_76]|nr:hypothetical protein K4K52_001279 [Colletotrichum sp. SAR 10_76]
MDPLWLAPHDRDERSCKGCGNYGKHIDMFGYYCAVWDRNMAVAGRTMAERAFARAERMLAAAQEGVDAWEEQIEAQDALVDSLREALDAAEARREDLDEKLAAQQALCERAERQKMALIDMMRAAEYREDAEAAAMENAGEEAGNFDAEMEAAERVQALDPHFWEAGTEWWDEETDDEPEELSFEQSTAYYAWELAYKRRIAGRRTHEAERQHGRRKRAERQLYVERRVREAEAAGRMIDADHCDHLVRSHIRAREQQGRQHAAREYAQEQRQRLSRVEAWAAGVQTPTPGPSVKQEDELSELHSPAMLSRVSVKREGTGEDLWRVASAVPDRTDVKQEMKVEEDMGEDPEEEEEEEGEEEEDVEVMTRAPKKEEPEPESEPQPGPSRSIPATPRAPASPAASGRPQRTTRRTRRTQPYPS